MRRFNLGYYIKEGFRSFAAHGFMTFASIAIMASCLIIMGSFTLVALNLEYNLDALMEDNEFLAYVDEEYTDEEGAALQSQIEAIDNVAECQYITREEALENYVSGLEDSSLYENVPASALRSRFSVRVIDIEQLEETIEEVREVEGIAKISASVDVANGLVTMRNVSVVIALALVVILVIVSFFIISNSIKLATSAREEEIAIMKMVGATNAFVCWPFVVEGVLLGGISAVVAALAEWGIYRLIRSAINVYTHVQLVSIIPIRTLAFPMCATFLGIGLLVGVVGSLITIRKYLKV
ncbi:MAG: permease-like cell division protein FtsX [Clostridiales bacterium]|nr:permease-like cell division protein FtsX [Clostridiales bacterium]